MTSATDSSARPSVVLVAEKLGKAGLEMLRKTPGLELRDLATASRAELLAAMPEATALVVRSATKVDRELIEAGRRLVVIGRAGVGVDNVDVAAATERGILVVNSPSGNTLAAIEHTFALLLSLLRRIPAAHASLSKGEWNRTAFTGVELFGKTVGVVGLGRIGSGVAERARAFGCQIVGFDPYLPPARAAELGYRMLSLDELLAVADVVTLHIPAGPDGKPLLGAAELARMKPTAVLVNCARGGVVDEKALAAALSEKKIAGAAVDVFSKEPAPPDHPLLPLPNVVVTPHLGASTAEAQERVAIQTVETLLAVLGGSLAVPAVNLPFSGASGVELTPLLDLSRALGALAGAVHGGPAAEVSVTVEALPESCLEAATAAALAGLLAGTLGADEVNVVSAPHLAAGRGLHVSRAHRPACAGWANRIVVRVSGSGRSAEAEGTLFSDRIPRVVGIDGFRIEFDPRGTVLHVVNRNVPGVIGRIGTLVGSAGVNISDMALARHPSGERAMALLCLDGELPADLAPRVAALADVESARLVRL